MSDPTPGLVITGAGIEPPVETVFGREGKVEAAPGDYDATQVLLNRTGGGTVADALVDVGQAVELVQDQQIQLEQAMVALSSTISTGSYRHTQPVPSSHWVIDHNLGKYPSVVVIDSAGDEVLGAVSYPTLNRLEVRFSGAFSGVAECN